MANGPRESAPYDALLLVSFGGPEGKDEVLPFLENVLRGRNVPRARLEEVAEHYYQFGGVSPLNAQNRALCAALEAELTTHGPALPLYYGCRNWHPLLPDTLAQMAGDGVRRALAIFTSAYSSYSGCRQYRENILAAQAKVGPGAPQVDRLRLFYNHPAFVEVNAAHVQAALAELPPALQEEAHIAFTAHSLPQSMADCCDYVMQLEETARLVAASVPGDHPWQLVYQSRSGPPFQPWLEPDILDHMESLQVQGAQALAIAPIGFLSDHMEVLFDLDTEALAKGQELGMAVARAATAGTHPKFVQMLRELIVERIQAEEGNQPPRAVAGSLGPCWDVCPPDCCLQGLPLKRPARRRG